jgi:hypothetical protein
MLQITLKNNIGEKAVIAVPHPPPPPNAYSATPT